MCLGNRLMFCAEVFVLYMTRLMLCLEVFVVFWQSPHFVFGGVVLPGYIALSCVRRCFCDLRTASCCDFFQVLSWSSYLAAPGLPEASLILHVFMFLSTFGDFLGVPGSSCWAIPAALEASYL